MSVADAVKGKTPEVLIGAVQLHFSQLGVSVDGEARVLLDGLVKEFETMRNGAVFDSQGNLILNPDDFVHAVLNGMGGYRHCDGDCLLQAMQYAGLQRREDAFDYAVPQQSTAYLTFIERLD